MIMAHLKESVLKGRYDLWLLGSLIAVPQKSFRNVVASGFNASTSLFMVIAGMSSCTKSPYIPFR